MLPPLSLVRSISIEPIQMPFENKVLISAQELYMENNGHEIPK